jgi:LDH2 family malate/lactate/ureidoglycolate dehydrogenase
MALSARNIDADHWFAAGTAESFIRDVMAAVGLPASDAARVAQLMTEADLTGADAHGIFRLPNTSVASGLAASTRRHTHHRREDCSRDRAG